jgi:hypothetical protein
MQVRAIRMGPVDGTARARIFDLEMGIYGKADRRMIARETGRGNTVCID